MHQLNIVSWISSPVWVEHVYRFRQTFAKLPKKFLQENNSWRLNQRQPPSAVICCSTAYSVMQLTEGFHAHEHAWLSTVNHSLYWPWRESCCCVFRCCSSGRSFRGLPPEKENKPWSASHERLPASQPAASRRLSSRSGPLAQDVWVRKWLCYSLSPFL